MQINKANVGLGLGFGAIVGLMTLLTVIWISLSHRAIQRIDQIVHTNHLKTELITRMRTAARERTLNVQKMLLAQDPFQRDEEYMRFNEFGTEFVVARNRLLALEMHEDEIEVLDDQNSLIGKVGTVQALVVELIFDGQEDEARNLILQQSIPLQDRAFSEMSRLLEIQKQKAAQAVEDTTHDYERGLTIMLILLGAIVLVSVMIAWFLIRRTAENERRLHQEKERAQVTLISIADGVITTDATGRVERLNTAAEVLTNIHNHIASHQALNQIFPIVHENDNSSVADPVRQALESQSVIYSEDDVLLSRPDGQKFAIEYTVSPIFDRSAQLTGAVLVFRNVTENRTLSRQLSYQAHHDTLTGLYNRSELENRLKDILSEVRRHPDQQHWLCYTDLDQFKVINDTCGHFAGDEFLKQVANELTRQTRESDVVARMGGDEFAIIFRGCSATHAREAVERIRRSLQESHFVWEDRSFNNTASIGLVAITADSGTVYDSMRAADTACYIAKDQGRNRVHIYEPNDDATSLRTGEMDWVHRIARALQEDRFVLYYQPITPLQARPIGRHGEILVRMLDEEGKLVPPMAFIPAAERYNVMTQIDRWVVRNTLELFFDYLMASSHSTDHSVSINLSAQSLCDDDFLNFVVAQLDETPLHPNQICFEITETAAIANLSRAIIFIKTLKERGCHFSLDDFGSGLSSFGYLKNLPVDYLKIDGSFVRDICTDPIDAAFVKSINQIGHVIGIKTIAEYVENDDIRTLLTRMGVDYGQGYGIAKPILLRDLILETNSIRTETARQ